MPKIDGITCDTYHDFPADYLASKSGQSKAVEDMISDIQTLKDKYTKAKTNIARIKGLDDDSFQMDGVNYLNEAANKIEIEAEMITYNIEKLNNLFPITVAEHCSEEATQTLAKVEEEYQKRVSTFNDAIKTYNTFANNNKPKDSEGKEQNYKLAKISESNKDGLVALGVSYGQGQLYPPAYYLRLMKSAYKSANTFYQYWVKPAMDLKANNNSGSRSNNYDFKAHTSDRM